MNHVSKLNKISLQIFLFFLNPENQYNFQLSGDPHQHIFCVWNLRFCRLGKYILKRKGEIFSEKSIQNEIDVCKVGKRLDILFNQFLKMSVGETFSLRNIQV